MFHYPHHIGDFIRDTANLSDSQTMAYLRMLWKYYADESPLVGPCDRIAFAVRSDEKTVALILDHYFTETPDGWRHSRCDSVISAYHGKAEKASESARKRWENANASKKNANALRTDSERNANAPKNDANHKPITNNQEPEDQEQESSLRSDSPDLPSAESGSPKSTGKAERLAEVTRDAIAAYNEIMAAPSGQLARVALADPPTETRKKEVSRATTLARRICQDQFGAPRITPDFWRSYFGECATDNHCNGTGPYGNGHATWKPDFEYLTRPKVIERVFNNAMSQPVSGARK